MPSPAASSGDEGVHGITGQGKSRAATRHARVRLGTSTAPSSGDEGAGRAAPSPVEDPGATPARRLLWSTGMHQGRHPVKGSSELMSPGTSTTCSCSTDRGTICRTARSLEARTDRGRDPLTLGACPVGRRDAPPVARDEAWEAVLRARGRQVVADPALLVEELRGHNRTDGVAPEVLGAGAAAAVAEEAGDGVSAARFQLAPEDISLSHAGQHRAWAAPMHDVTTRHPLTRITRRSTTSPATSRGSPRGTR